MNGAFSSQSSAVRSMLQLGGDVMDQSKFEIPMESLLHPSPTPRALPLSLSVSCSTVLFKGPHPTHRSEMRD